MGTWTEPPSESFGEGLSERRVISTPSAESGYFWGGESLAFEQACKHFVVVGGTGSGKTITLNMLMQSVLCKIGTGKPNSTKRRAVIYDPKSDLVRLICGLLPEGVKLRILNPLDARFAPWDISADVLTETDALEFASILIPRNERESNPYFPDSARALVAAVIERFITAIPGKWSLRDVLLAFNSKKRLASILAHEETKYLLDHFQPENERNFAGVKSTIDTALAAFRPIAALLHNTTAAALPLEQRSENEKIERTPFSLKRWILDQEESVLVLGSNENAREATDTLNRLFFRQLSKFLISRDGVIEKDETWIFLDELREAGRLDGLRQLLLRGRSKGVAVAMGFQDVQGIYAAYGEHEGAELIGAAQNLVLLHINPSAPKTAEWASSVFGTRRLEERSRTRGDGGLSVSLQMQMVPNLLPILFTQLPLPAQEQRVHYFAYTNTQKHGRGYYEWSFLEKEGALKKADRNVSEFESQTDLNRFRLSDWDERDIKLTKALQVDLSDQIPSNHVTPNHNEPTPIRNPLLR
jgi:type IV secretory pathway TraG/TraD family ATPase VirD4